MIRKSIVKVLLIMLIFSMPTSSWAEDKQLVLRVDGLACPFCAYGLEKKLMAMEGMLSYDADLEKGEVYVDVNEDAEIDMKSLARAVKESGFTLRKVFIKTENGERKEMDIANGS